MYVQPNSTVKFLKDIPLDKNYDNTIYWTLDNAGKANQIAYFNSKAKYTATNLTYQRVNRGSLKVNLTTAQLYDCNYMMFQNTSFENRWFFAFIDKIEYISDICTQVYYTIDVLQTWHFDYGFGDSFVEREHQSTDVVGDNLKLENLELGEYQIVSKEKTGVVDTARLLAPTDLVYVISSNKDNQLVAHEGSKRSGIYNAIWYNVYENNDTGLAELAAFIRASEWFRSVDCVNVFMMPKIFVSDYSDIKAVSYTFTKSKPTTLGTYTPRNKKLLTYPYMFMYVNNNQGEESVYRYENFSAENCTFYLVGNMTCQPEMKLIPMNYLGADYDYSTSLTVKGFPQIPVLLETYKQEIVNNAISIGLGAISMATVGIPAFNIAHSQATYASKGIQQQIASGDMTNLPVNQLRGYVANQRETQAIGNIANEVAGSVAQVAESLLSPPSSKSMSGAMLLASESLLDFMYYKKCIKPEYAKVIDDYFDRYGYATKRVKKPNRNVRKYWTYCQTLGCDIHAGSDISGLPSDEIDFIGKLYDKGITWWDGAKILNGSLEVGDFATHMDPSQQALWNTPL